MTLIDTYSITSNGVVNFCKTFKVFHNFHQLVTVNTPLIRGFIPENNSNWNEYSCQCECSLRLFLPKMNLWELPKKDFTDSMPFPSSKQQHQTVKGQQSRKWRLIRTASNKNNNILPAWTYCMSSAYVAKSSYSEASGMVRLRCQTSNQ